MGIKTHTQLCPYCGYSNEFTTMIQKNCNSKKIETCYGCDRDYVLYYAVNVHIDIESKACPIQDDEAV